MWKHHGLLCKFPRVHNYTSVSERTYSFKMLSQIKIKSFSCCVFQQCGHCICPHSMLWQGGGKRECLWGQDVSETKAIVTRTVTGLETRLGMMKLMNNFLINEHNQQMGKDAKQDKVDEWTRNARVKQLDSFSAIWQKIMYLTLLLLLCHCVFCLCQTIVSGTSSCVSSPQRQCLRYKTKV